MDQLTSKPEREVNIKNPKNHLSFKQKPKLYMFTKWQTNMEPTETETS